MRNRMGRGTVDDGLKERIEDGMDKNDRERLDDGQRRRGIRRRDRG